MLQQDHPYSLRVYWPTLYQILKIPKMFGITHEKCIIYLCALRVIEQGQWRR